jgi:hypothetical protein
VKKEAMNVQQPPGISWSPSEAAAVNEFLNTAVGRKWLGILLSRKPRLDLTTTERAALSGAYGAGYEAFFGEIAGTRVSMTVDSASIKAIDPTKD